MPTPPTPSQPDYPVDLLGSSPKPPPDSRASSRAGDALKTEEVLWTAEFAPVVAWMFAAQWTIIAAIPIVGFGVIGIVFVPCVAVPVLLGVLAAVWFAMLALAQKYVASMRCLLTTRSVRAGGGVFFKWERSIPLDKITDVVMAQGPLARMFEVEFLGVETAGGGQGPGQSSTIPLFGVVNPKEFRRAVLEQRDRVVGSAERGHSPAAHAPTPAAGPAPVASGDNVRDVLIEIRDELRALRAENAQRERGQR